jgi:hypothetical protein
MPKRPRASRRWTSHTRLGCPASSACWRQVGTATSASRVLKLEVATKLLGTDGARTRMLSKDVNEALIWLALLTKSGMILTAELTQRGLASPDLLDARFGHRRVA